ncbi:MAG TPA: hypothetical protein VN922_18570 [Bacteroidia bacterium]|nr:hypothetical protein [Bacteroidia bacterium]
METNHNIEKEIDNTLNVAKKIAAVEASAYFTESTMQRISVVSKETFLAGYGLLKAAAIVILICLNVYTIKYVFESPEPQVPQVTASIDDLVNDYQVADINSDWLNSNKTDKP